MKVIIAGGAKIADSYFVQIASMIENLNLPISEVLEGGGTGGSDRIARFFAIKHGFPYRSFPAEWGRTGLNAFRYRNKRMIAEAAAVIHIHNPKHKATRDMQNLLKLARESRTPVYTLEIQ
jgi:hypothetical protein